MTATCVLMWALGSEALYEPWPPIVTIVPGLLLFVGAWAFASGRDETFLVLVVAFSFVVQTHGSYLVLGRRHRARSPRSVTLRAAGTARLALAARRFAVGFVLWLQPLIDQFWGSGNLGRILRFARDGGPARRGHHTRPRRRRRAPRPWCWCGRPSGYAAEWRRACPTAVASCGRSGGRVFRPDWLSAPLATRGLSP